MLCAHSPASQPASTSPVPAVASAALPVALMRGTSKGAAITLPEPFRTTQQANRSASACAARRRSAWTSAVPTPSKRAASSGCGVSTVGSPRAARCLSSVCKPVSDATAFSASASSTRRAARPSRRGNGARTASPPPQPHTIVLALIADAGPPDHAARSISSGCSRSTAIELFAWSAWSSSSTNTRPAPAASAARAASSAAPAMPTAPPTTATSPKLPLCCACRRRLRVVASRLAPSRACGTSAARSRPRPSASNHTRPAWSRPAAVKRPGLSVSKASVCAALMQSSPNGLPMSAFRPDGTSTASTGQARALSCRIDSASAP